MDVKDRISEGQRRSLFYIFKNMKFDEDMRHDFISDYTDGRTDSLKELGYIEAQSMIRYLQELNRMPQTRKYKSESDRLRKGVIKAIGRYFEKCGRTDISNPELEFRYCSRCNGYHCYCEDHISNHSHIE